MRKRDLTRLLIENTVDRALRDMERDAHRSLRNLVDLALTFSKGTFERHFLTLCRSMLENETSPYYQLLDRALRTCDRQTLKTFGINVGYEACSKGARRIREIEAAQGFNVPWALTIQAGSQGLSRLYLQRLVTEGTELGIRVFLLQDFQLEQDVLEQLLREHPTCAFVVFTTGARGADWNLANLAGFPTSCSQWMPTGPWFWSCAAPWKRSGCLTPCTWTTPTKPQPPYPPSWRNFSPWVACWFCYTPKVHPQRRSRPYSSRCKTPGRLTPTRLASWS